MFERRRGRGKVTCEAPHGVPRVRGLKYLSHVQSSSYCCSRFVPCTLGGWQRRRPYRNRSAASWAGSYVCLGATRPCWLSRLGVVGVGAAGPVGAAEACDVTAETLTRSPEGRARPARVARRHEGGRQSHKERPERQRGNPSSGPPIPRSWSQGDDGVGAR